MRIPDKRSRLLCPSIYEAPRMVYMPKLEDRTMTMRPRSLERRFW